MLCLVFHKHYPILKCLLTYRTVLLLVLTIYAFFVNLNYKLSLALSVFRKSYKEIDSIPHISCDDISHPTSMHFRTLLMQSSEILDTTFSVTTLGWVSSCCFFLADSWGYWFLLEFLLGGCLDTIGFFFNVFSVDSWRHWFSSCCNSSRWILDAIRIFLL